MELTIQLDTELITENTVLMIIEQGSDAEKWAGHFGTRFRNDTIYIRSYFPERDWTQAYPVPEIAVPYLTHFNLGHGHHFWDQGKKMLVSGKKYNFLSDF